MKNLYNNWHVASIPAPKPYVFSDGSVSKYMGWSPCVTWCREQFGDSMNDGWRFLSEGVFEFREEQDYLLFLLKWS